MIETRTQRRLAAILAADVEGYSQMMGRDEDGTLAAMRDLWGTVFNPVVAVHRGRIFKTMGDAALVEFASAVDAVECAVAVQGAMALHNARTGAPEIALRIGVNLGDVVSDGDDMLGDGVNVAARLESQAPRGGILVSDAVHAQVRGKVDVVFADAGELSLKNIAAPVRAWRWGDGASAEVQALPEDLPSIAVLPFTNMSGDAEQEYFSDGISEDIITDLSKLGGLTVIARNSSFVYKGRTIDIRAVGRDLGVTSVLEGSIRRAGNRVRITAQLIDARSGAHLWAERYDRDLTDIFAVQDEVTLQIVSALKVRLQPVERSRLAGTRATNLDAHDQYLRAKRLAADLPDEAQDRRAAFQRVIEAHTRATEIDPAYAAPHAGLSFAWIFDHANRWSGTADPLARAAAEADLAIAADPDEVLGHVASAVVHLYKGDVAAMKIAADRALEISPNSAAAIGIRGNVEMMMGNAEGAIPWLQRSIRLDAEFGKQGLHFLGSAQLLAGRYSEAAATFRERIRQVPTTDLSRSLLASTLGHLGQVDEARRVWAEIAGVNPDYSLDTHLGRLTYANPADPARIREGLAKAGLPAASSLRPL
ncbi:MAG: adenylate/guanylate cyclase domain-containing protein [Gemmobacter sp.]